MASLSPCPECHSGDRWFGRRMNQHHLSLGFLIVPSLPPMLPMTLIARGEHEARGLCFALTGTQQMPYCNDCLKLLKNVLNSSVLAAAFSLTP